MSMCTASLFQWQPGNQVMAKALDQEASDMRGAINSNVGGAGRLLKRQMQQRDTSSPASSILTGATPVTAGQKSLLGT